MWLWVNLNNWLFHFSKICLYCPWPTLPTPLKSSRVIILGIKAFYHEKFCLRKQELCFPHCRLSCTPDSVQPPHKGQDYLSVKGLKSYKPPCKWPVSDYDNKIMSSYKNKCLNFSHVTFSRGPFWEGGSAHFGKAALWTEFMGYLHKKIWGWRMAAIASAH